jgi:hypothetical protein
MLDDSQRALENWQDKHREAASEIRVLSDKARQATTLADEYQHDLEVARGQLEDERRLVSSLQVRVSQHCWRCGTSGSRLCVTLMKSVK